MTDGRQRQLGPDEGRNVVIRGFAARPRGALVAPRGSADSTGSNRWRLRITVPPASLDLTTAAILVTANRP